MVNLTQTFLCVRGSFFLFSYYASPQAAGSCDMRVTMLIRKKRDRRGGVPCFERIGFARIKNGPKAALHVSEIPPHPAAAHGR